MRIIAAVLAVSLAAPPCGLGPLGELSDLAVDRLELADLVAAAKFGTSLPIDDPVREQQVLDDVRTKSIGLGLDPADGVRFFRDQIEANKLVQRGLFDHWTRYPDQAPTRRPDLGTEVRPRLDLLTGQLLRELKATEEIRTPSIRCEVVAELAERSQRLDALHRKGLHQAFVHVCQD